MDDIEINQNSRRSSKINQESRRSSHKEESDLLMHISDMDMTQQINQNKIKDLIKDP